MIGIGILVATAATVVLFDLGPLAGLVALITLIYLLVYPLIRLVDHFRRPRPRRPGYLALWLTGLAFLVVVLPPYVNVASRAKIAKAQADARTIASAVSMYSAHMGALPVRLDDLNVVATNARGETAGPFMPSTPSAPTGWAAYVYTSTPAGIFTISTSGEGMTVRVP